MATSAVSGGIAAWLAAMPMGGGGRIGAAASFLTMWTLMMAAMMLPSLAAMLWGHRRHIGTAGGLPPAIATVLVAGGYFLVWTLLGAVVYALGGLARTAAMHWPALAAGLPIATGEIVLLAGLLQLTPWKARQLACCRQPWRRESAACACASPLRALTACRQGVRLGLQCCRCCAGLTAALLVTGMMSWPAMLAATGAINLERLAPAGERIARAVGVVLIAAGSWLTLRALALR